VAGLMTMAGRGIDKKLLFEIGAWLRAVCFSLQGPDLPVAC
jgi:hypothetical protein